MADDDRGRQDRKRPYDSGDDRSRSSKSYRPRDDRSHGRGHRRDSRDQPYHPDDRGEEVVRIRRDRGPEAAAGFPSNGSFNESSQRSSSVSHLPRDQDRSRSRNTSADGWRDRQAGSRRGDHPPEEYASSPRNNNGDLRRSSSFTSPGSFGDRRRSFGEPPESAPSPSHARRGDHSGDRRSSFGEPPESAQSLSYARRGDHSGDRRRSFGEPPESAPSPSHARRGDHSGDRRSSFGEPPESAESPSYTRRGEHLGSLSGENGNQFTGMSPSSSRSSDSIHHVRDGPISQEEGFPAPPTNTWGQRRTQDGRDLQSRLATLASTTIDAGPPPPQTGERRGGVDREGRRGQRERPPRPSDAEQADYVCTRPQGLQKQAVPGSINFKYVELVANFFRVVSLGPNQCHAVYHYHVDFEPPLERTFEKRMIFRSHASKIHGWNIFDGSALYTASLLPPQLMEFLGETSEKKFHVKIKLVNEVMAADPVRFQINNTVVRSCMEKLGLRLMGRHYYDDSSAVRYDDVRLQIWPGFKTSMRQHEDSLLLCVEMTNKVLRMETALDIIYTHRGDREKIKNELLGCIVMTNYNKRTYRIDDINWDEAPDTPFNTQQGRAITFAEYLREQYNIQLQKAQQPILYSRVKKKDLRKGMCKNIGLVPELCQMTGLKDDHRKNFNLMKRLNEQLQMEPTKRVQNISRFYDLMKQQQVMQKVLEPAGLKLDSRLVNVKGHCFPPETISFAGRTVTPQKDRYDWSGDLVRNHMFKTVELKNWAVIATQSLPSYETFIKLIIDGAGGMNFHVRRPRTTKEVRRGRDQQLRSYMNCIEELMNTERDLQMVMCILPSPDETLYGEIKRKCYLDYGIPSQCVLQKNAMAPPNKQHVQRGVAAKLAIQMNTKLGGVPWKVPIPMKGLMVIGFNISSALGSQRSRSTSGALVASLTDDQTKFYSCILDHEGGQFLSSQLAAKVVQAVHVYKDENKNLPTRILFYRDGVGEGQLQTVVSSEVNEIKQTLKDNIYRDAELKFGFIVVNKRVNTKFFHPLSGRFQNPEPGTVVDDVVTLPERYDFYLISAKGTGQGTISPTSYNVINDTMGLSPVQVQLLTHKLCHLYFNWSSTVSVPAVCQYAHKLAFLQNLMTKCRRGDGAVQQPKGSLCTTLFYL